MSSIISGYHNPAIRQTIFQRIRFGFYTFIKRLIGRKSMSRIQAEIETQNELRRALNWFMLTAIGLGDIIGAGIVVLSDQAAVRYSGPSLIVSFIVTGVVALLSALSFSELATMMSVSGAAYASTYAALGGIHTQFKNTVIKKDFLFIFLFVEYLAWFIEWNYALLYQSASFSVVVSWSEYLVDFIELVSDCNVTRAVVQVPIAWNETGESLFITGQAINLPAIAIIIILTIVLVIGIRTTAIFNLVLVVIKVIILLIFIFACCKYVNRNNYQPFIPPNEGSFSKYGVTGMLRGCIYVFFSYLGFESIATIAQEATTPTSRSIPIAHIGSVLISLLIYIGISTVMVGLVPYKLLDSDNPFSVAVGATPYGLWLLILMDLDAIAALTTVALTILLSQNRIFYAMAQDGLLPSFFAKIHRNTETPRILTLICGGSCAIISGIFLVDIVGETTSISALITYIFVQIEVIIMRRTHPNMLRAFQVPCGSWLLPTVGSLLCILLLKGISSVTAYRFLVWTGIGQIVYFCYGYWHSKRRDPIRDQSMNSAVGLLPSVETISMEYVHVEPKSESTSETNEYTVEDDLVHYF